ncbi:glycosyltransferase [Corynebacterium riegelii]|uniref:glycosyltransferase n=1 Tax=Corynebacterium riegelii TaxID=156976 RepID=UPI0023F0DA66|nr:glycosyltransferase [Corynebacterium riegelii]
MKPVFIGQTRYSLFVPDSGAWRASSAAGQEVSDYRNYLYAPERLDFRDRVFTTLTVPSLAVAAKTHEVHHIVSYSESLPEKYIDSLVRTAEKYPFLVLQELPDGVSDWGRSEQIIKEKVGEGVFGRYRLDDDDLLSKHYFDVMHRFVKPEYVGMVVSMPRGIEAIYSNGHYFNFREAHVPMNSMGMLYISELGQNGRINAPRAGAHDKADRIAPVILDASRIGYLRTNHIGQDNMLRHQSSVVDGQLVTNMDRFPALPSVDVVRENFPAAASEVLQDEKAVAEHWNGQIEDGIRISLDGESHGLTVTITGTAPTDVREHPLALSFQLESGSGRALSPRAKVRGLSTSKNPQIGQFAYFDIKPGPFNATVSAYLAEGLRVRGARIVPLNSTSCEIYIEDCEVDHEGQKVNFSPLSEEVAFPTSRRQRMQLLMADLRSTASPVLRRFLNRILGANRTNAVLEFLTAKLRRI